VLKLIKIKLSIQISIEIKVNIKLTVEFHHTTKSDAKPREGKPPLTKKSLTETLEHVTEYPNNWFQKSKTAPQEI
jgi:hypothetical protein